MPILNHSAFDPEDDFRAHAVWPASALPGMHNWSNPDEEADAREVRRETEEDPAASLSSAGGLEKKEDPFPAGMKSYSCALFTSSAHSGKSHGMSG